jgi:hypothetical protein
MGFTEALIALWSNLSATGTSAEITDMIMDLMKINEPKHIGNAAKIQQFIAQIDSCRISKRAIQSNGS